MAKELSAQDQADIEEARQAYKAYLSHFDATEPQKESKNISTGGAAQSALEHFGNAASLGYLPQISALTEPVTAKIFDAITGNNISQDIPSYVQRRDEVTARLKQQEKENPTASTLGSIGGGLSGGIALSSILPGAAAAKGAGQVIAQGAKTGAVIAGASNPGETEGDVSPLQLGDRAKNAAVGGALGGLMSAAGYGIGKAGSKIADKLSDKAERSMFKALGPYQRDVLQNADNINEIGRTALDKGVSSGLPKSYGALSENAQSAKQEVGKEIGDIVERLSNDANVGKVSKEEIASVIKDKMLLPKGVSGAEANNRSINNLVDEFLSDGKKDLTLKEARELKAILKKQINWDRLPGADIPVTESVQRAQYTGLKDAENKIAKDLAKTSASPDQVRFIEAKKEYANLGQAAKIAGKKENKVFANQVLGLKDAIYGSAGASIGAGIGYEAGGEKGAALGGAIGGGVGGLGNKLIATYGNQVIARASDAVSRKISQYAPQIAKVIQSNPAVMASLISQELKNDQPAQENITLDPIQRRLVEIQNKGRAPAKGKK